jgi:hypothetical protein
MSGSNVDSQSYAPLPSFWRNWLPDRPKVRLFALAAAVFFLSVGAFACTRPIIANFGPVKFGVENPFKPFLFALAALQVWCLFTPQMHEFFERRGGVSLWKIMLIAGAVEAGALAVIGIAAIDLRWTAAPLWTWPTPTQAATTSFILLIAALSMSDPRAYVRQFIGRCKDQWTHWDWRTKTVAALFALQIIFMVSSVSAYWRHASAMFAYHAPELVDELGLDHRPISNFENFCERCRQEIPADARILYHGPNEGLILAYELYPRRVFMLPEEQLYFFRNCWSIEPWCKGMTADPLDGYWRWDKTPPKVSPEEFIADHQISYVVTFENEHASGNSIQKLR